MHERDRDYSLLDERFTPFYNSGERVEVVWKEGWEDLSGRIGKRTQGRISRFYVGRSTGWKPIYLMILNKNSTCGMAISSEGVESIRGTGIYRR